MITPHIHLSQFSSVVIHERERKSKSSPTRRPRLPKSTLQTTSPNRKQRRHMSRLHSLGAQHINPPRSPISSKESPGHQHNCTPPSSFKSSGHTTPRSSPKSPEQSDPVIYSFNSSLLRPGSLHSSPPSSADGGGSVSPSSSPQRVVKGRRSRIH